MRRVETAGRILCKLMDRGVVVPVPTLRRNLAARRVRHCSRALRPPPAEKAQAHPPGEIVQIDTLFVNVRPDRAMKHITAYDPVAKVARVASSATAQAATALLDKLCTEAPFPVSGIQVDGGSEADFETACATRGLTLFVLPPGWPQLNGAVERAQGTWRYEFHGCFDLPCRINQLQAHVDAFAHRVNHHRPHPALGDQTPAEYFQPNSSGHPALHMS